MTNLFNLKKIKNVFIIAEIGVNHEGSITKCKKLIRLASKAGADAVKIQTVNEDDSYLKNTKSYKTFKRRNFTDQELKEIKYFSNKCKILFFSTPGDIASLRRLKKLKVKMIKISSGLMNHYPLIHEATKLKVPIIISTGMAEKKDLIDLKNYLRKIKFSNFAILKCTSQYPAEIKNINLDSMDKLKAIFKSEIGYSDHTIGTLAPLVAVSKGAKIIEKHFTLNKNKKGSDHKISLEYKDFKQMVDQIRYTEKIIGKAKLDLSNSVKKVRKLYRRYLFTKQNIKKVKKFNINNIAFKRSDKNINGLEPKEFFSFNNKKSKINLKKNLIIKKNFIAKNNS